MVYVLTFISSLILSLFLSPLTIKLSEKLKIFSKSSRETGSKNKPCLGGVAIYLAFLASNFIAYLFHAGIYPKFTGLIISSTMIVIFGLIDDAKELKPFEKIGLELFAIAFLILSGIVTKISFLPVWANMAVTLVWVLFITNAFNLLDIADGLMSGLVIIISLTLFVISMVSKDIFSSIVLIALIGAHLGFLRHNYPPARLYMGDTGSLFSGFLIAAIAINISYAPIERPVALVTPILAMSLPIYDTFFLIIMRLRKRRPIFSKTNDHLALRLVTMGYNVTKSIWIMYLFSIFLAAASIIVAFSNNRIGGMVLVIVMVAFILMGKRAGMVKIED